MKTFLPFLLLLATSFCQAQEDVKIIHYLKKSSECLLQIPGNTFSSKGLGIPLVDSLYASAEITVKKVKQSDLQLSNYKIFVQQDTVVGISLVLKSKKSKENFNSYLTGLGAESHLINGECMSKEFTIDGRELLLSKVIHGKKWKIELIKK